ncbi:OLC1v1001614C1 [Oldenlandia corymbosa var. corymbosa]|uniref:OLC1v1001614C1 n=1 Tax=Oldenlandia corymbosa var. corymbosa TaxID=529605 RepID=A0AAV1D8H0_OLDCO|nr:OLC1v1001614C1 [Oldenlandia corymbosa var. corymbosa]
MSKISKIFTSRTLKSPHPIRYPYPSPGNIVELNIPEEWVHVDGVDGLNVPEEGLEDNVASGNGLIVPEEGVHDNVDGDDDNAVQEMEGEEDGLEENQENAVNEPPEGNADKEPKETGYLDREDDDRGDQGKGIRHNGPDDDMLEKHLDDDLKYNNAEHKLQIKRLLLSILLEVDKSCSSFGGGHEFLKKEMKQAVKIVPPDWIRNVICWVLHLPGDDEGNPPEKYSFLDAGTSSYQAEDEDLEEAVPENPAGLQALDEEHGEVHHDGEIDNVEQGTEANIGNGTTRSNVCLQKGSKKRLITRPHKIGVGCAVCGFMKLPEYMARATCKCRGYFICVKDCLINLAMAEAQENVQIVYPDCSAHLLEERLVPRLLQWFATRSRN